ncbi:DUF262 domain-containing protein [Cellulophaga baltica]|uniref:DUF262 domain-containing protein n=1 Tax=Cellulophaga baltica TaxID=76594 RepID=UPI0021479673|nr:DUF262 domain-containing protein [Cellulophaga baltica]MCR1025459.1 DUF262 domain-containing protein [Cellulophaga baltica]
MVNTSTKFTFLEIVRKYRIIIPHLQRDYVQGKDENRSKLIGFLEYIHDNLKKENPINLDFIFGYEDKAGKELIPIDGQQRLTTVFLIHWFLAKMSGDYDQFKRELIKGGELYFNYETRINSQDFIYSLVNKEMELSKRKVSTEITSKKWFYLPWKQDSTISAMINTLDCIQEIFKDDTITEWYDKLKNSNLIQFEFLNPKAIELSDEFYIKMNARGLPLSNFENFKANLLGQIYETLGENIKNDFSLNIDETWSDSLWNWTVKVKVKYDTALYNVLNYLFDILNAKNKSETSNYSFPDSINTLITRENILFITDVFDFLCKAIGDKKFEDVLFTDNVKKLMTNIGFGHFERLLLYAQLSYSLKYNISDFQNLNYQDFVRINKHILINTNQSKKTEYASDLRPSRYSDLIETVNNLTELENPFESLASFQTNNKILLHEIEKAKIILEFSEKKEAIQKLEDHRYLNGWLVNFMFFFQSDWNATLAVQKFYEVWESNDKDLYRALYSIGDYTTYVSSSGLGPVFYAGKQDKWNRILANNNSHENPRQINVFKKLFHYLIFDNFQLNQIPLPVEKDYKYYFAKYPKILTENHSLFVYDDRLENIELMTKTMLSGSHVNYLNRAVKFKLNDMSIFETDGFQFYDYSLKWSSIKFNDLEVLYFDGKNWLINNREEILPSKDLETNDLVELASQYIQVNYI